MIKWKTHWVDKTPKLFQSLQFIRCGLEKIKFVSNAWSVILSTMSEKRNNKKRLHLLWVIVLLHLTRVLSNNLLQEFDSNIFKRISCMDCKSRNPSLKRNIFCVFELGFCRIRRWKDASWSWLLHMSASVVFWGISSLLDSTLRGFVLLAKISVLWFRSFFRDVYLDFEYFFLFIYEAIFKASISFCRVLCTNLTVTLAPECPLFPVLFCGMEDIKSLILQDHHLLFRACKDVCFESMGSDTRDKCNGKRRHR